MRVFLFVFQKAIPVFICMSFSTQMGLSGLEPPTSRLSGVRSNQLSYKPLAFYSVTGNGDGEIRTLDPLLARQVLSQLSYTPRFSVHAKGYEQIYIKYFNM